MADLRIALERVEFLPLRQVTDDTSILTLKNLVFEPLCRWKDGRIEPALFNCWEHDEAGRVWHFQIRENATFHDGKPCVAEDVLAFIDGILNSVDSFGMKWAYARYFAGTVFSAESHNCVKVEHPAPIADITEIFSECYVCREDTSGRPVLGTGSYRIAEFEPRDRAVLEGARDRISLRAMPDAADRFSALVDGRVDVAANLERMVPVIQFDSAFRWIKSVNTVSVMYYLNCSAGSFVSPDARLAVNHAIDAQAIVDELFQGLGIPATTVVSPYHLGFRAAGVAPIPYDPDRARDLFDKVGGSGEVVIRTPQFMPEKSDRISAMVQDAMAEVGVRARLDLQPDRPEYAREVGRKEIGDMAIFDSTPHSTFRVLNDKISSAVKGIWWQGYDDAETEALIAAANSTVDDAARESVYGRCLTRLNINPPWLYLFHPVEVMACRRDMENIGLDHKGIIEVH
ncbi:MAG: ABC transporter substrate-binding protein [Rhodospirillales bacterium]|nr:ABC transporter substrate-binding protein [Rhodospirillales bacterium]